MKVIRRPQEVLAVLRVFPPTVSLPASLQGLINITDINGITMPGKARNTDRVSNPTNDY